MNTNLHDFEDERRILEIVLEAEVDLSDVLRRLRVVDVHVHQGDGTVLPKRHLVTRKLKTRLGSIQMMLTRTHTLGPVTFNVRNVMNNRG